MSEIRDLSKLDEVMDYIEAHPEEHDQRVWLARTACGTRGCLAGHAILLNVPASRLRWKWALRQGGPNSMWGVITEDGVCTDPYIAAMEILGLSASEAGVLFHETASLEDLKMWVKRLHNGEGITNDDDDPECIDEDED